MSVKTEELKKAIDHVKKSHPSLKIVIFSSDGRWQYMDENFDGFIFGKEINTSILEEAVDSLEDLPAIFEI